MRKARWIAPWKDSREKPVIYHCVSRVVDRRLVFGAEEKEKLRTLMRMYENFSGCRVLAYCFMSNHFHLLLEVPPMAEGGISDDELLRRLGALYGEGFVREVAKELLDARKRGLDFRVREIHERFTYRMHDLSEFMKGFLQRYTPWHNRRHGRKGTLWEDRFKSVIVEDGVAARTMAAYIDLNPVRAEMVKEPADYRWSSYGEAIGGGPKGNGKKARAGLVRAMRAHQGVGADAGLWSRNVSLEPTGGTEGSGQERKRRAPKGRGTQECVASQYRRILMSGAEEKADERVNRAGKVERVVTRKGISVEGLGKEKDISYGRMLRCRIRYFTDGAVIGSRKFVNDAFDGARERFGPKRKDGARKMRGRAGPAAGVLWSLRDLRSE